MIATVPHPLRLILTTLLLTALPLAASLAQQGSPVISWSSYLGREGINGAEAIAATADGGFVVAGMMRNDSTFPGLAESGVTLLHDRFAATVASFDA